MDRSLVTSFVERAGYELRSIEPLAGDVSPRRYFRLELGAGETAILAAYPTGSGDGCDRFERSTALLEGCGVRVPRVLESDCRGGLMLLEDLGAETLFDRLSEGPDESQLEHAIEAGRRIAGLDPAAVAELNPRLDGELLVRELRQTVDLYLVPRGLLGADPASRTRAAQALQQLCSALGAEDPTPCHRDFMARNLVPGPGRIAVLDHQDLRLGPPGYDLASLLNDSFFPSTEVEARLLADGLAGRDPRSYHRAAVQRTLKAIGTFTAFANRGSRRHLPLIAPTLERARLHLPLAPETAEISAELAPLWARHLESG